VSLPELTGQAGPRSSFAPLVHFVLIILELETACGWCQWAERLNLGTNALVVEDFSPNVSRGVQEIRRNFSHG